MSWVIKYNVEFLHFFEILFGLKSVFKPNIKRTQLIRVAPKKGLQFYVVAICSIHIVSIINQVNFSIVLNNIFVFVQPMLHTNINIQMFSHSYYFYYHSLYYSTLVIFSLTVLKVTTTNEFRHNIR